MSNRTLPWLSRTPATTPTERWKRLVLLGLPVLLALFPLFHDNDADIDSAANAMSYAALALGLNIVVGFTGLLDLGYAAFFAIGAYYYGILTSFQVMPLWSDHWAPLAALGLVEKMNQGGPDLVHFTLSFWLALPTAALVSAFFGILFGAPTLRLRGDYLAIVTNGAAGLNGVQAPRILGYNFGVDSTPYYYVGLVLIYALIFVSIRLRDSRIGRA